MNSIKNFKFAHYILSQKSPIFIGTLNENNAICLVPSHKFEFENLLEELGETELESKTMALKIPVTFKLHLVYPASDAHINKYLESFKYTIESYEDYKSNDSFLKESWLDNIINSKASGEKVYFEDEQSLIIADYKWDKISIDNLYLLMIFKNEHLRSLRDVQDVKILEKAKQSILKVCKEYGLSEEDIWIFFHYRPSYFRLHIHIVNISKALNFLGIPSRNVLLEDVITNIKMSPDYYKEDCYFIGFK